MSKDSIKKHFQVFLKSAAWSKDWKPKSQDVLPSSLFLHTTLISIHKQRNIFHTYNKEIDMEKIDYVEE